MAKIPCEYSGGGYKVNIGRKVNTSLTTNAYGMLPFPSKHLVTCASYGNYPVNMISYQGTADYGMSYLEGSTVKLFSANTTYQINYTYIEEVT